MKNLKSILASTVFATAVMVVSAAYAQPTYPGYATVVRVQGIATYSLGDGQWYPLVAGKTLPAGSSIRTGEGGIADVVLGKSIDFPQSRKLPDRIAPAVDSPVRGLISFTPAAEQNVIRMTPGTTLAIDKLTTTDTGADTVSDTELNLQQGKIFASVKKLSATSQYLVKTPTGIAGVRGTKFSMSADGAVAVYESTHGGLVFSTSAGGTTQTFTIAPGQMLDTSTGSPVPFSAGLSQTLYNSFASLQTIYVAVVGYDYHYGNTFVSPTSGNLGNVGPGTPTPPPGD